ncbi:hypothetical protein ONS95_002513 [Cadophora gregata]|uniref:uncharacterized protein n=1 Tax=Cadophora gregata TaxID=51156 RepID=UPI0026DB247D|nr:uncharacterized protein ONS95_002513 [Cadophora gregata]KAK0109842.1 hypothetical protein ONS95_002513 [Cadophora gregata]KAK0110533.1 hypothetical protein ONS96_002139 [Cadophora gregata f. sp. sojae]
MTNYVHPQTPSEKTPKTIISSIAVGGHIAFALSFVYVYFAAVYCILEAWYHKQLQLDIDNTHDAIAIAWLFIASGIMMYMPQNEEKKEKEKKEAAEEASKSKTKSATIPAKMKAKELPISSWDSNVNIAWSWENWEELMKAAYKERAQTPQKVETNNMNQAAKIQREQARISRLYATIRMLGDVIESLKMEVDRRERQVEEIESRLEVEVCDDPTLEEDREEADDGKLEARQFQCRAGYWCRRNCCLEKKRKLPVRSDANDQHEADDEEYVMVTTGADF